MPSLGSILQIAKTGLIQHQSAINVTSHNIANASTEGYSRQRAVMSPNSPIAFPDGVFGTGVHIADVQQVADPLLDAAMYRELGGAGQHGTRAGVLERVEALFQEPSDSSLGASLDAFLSNWSELASNPSSAPVRSALRQSGTELTVRLRDLASGLDTLREESEDRALASVDRANSLLTDIATLNRQIVAYEVGGKTAGDLRDERSRRVAELADLLPVQVTERDNGSIGITTAGISVVDGVEKVDLELRQVGGVFALARVGGASEFSEQGGAIGGILQTLNTDIPAVRQDLDALAGAIVTGVNAAHQTGTNPAGTTGIDFFDPAGVSASSIDLSADVLADLDAISAGTPDGLGGYRAGANDVALAIAGLRDTDVPSLGTTLVDHYDGLVLDLGTSVRSSKDAAAVHETLADQAELRRMSLSGVSVDEELVKLIEFQAAYQSSARVISVADEMIQTLLNI